MARSISGDSIIDRTVRIFQSFDPDTESMTVSELARRAGLPLSTTSRLVDQLSKHGLLSREDRLVGVGVRMWELASRASPTRGLREVAMPFMEDLHAVVGHHAQLGVMDHGEVLFLERLTAPQSVVNITQIAGRLPLHASSSGLVLLAHASPAEQERALGMPLKRFTEDTIVDPAQLRSLLAEIRRRGFVHCAGHIHPDATGIAVPLHDPDGAVVAALAVVVPTDEHSRQHIVAVRTTAAGIRRVMKTQQVGSSAP